MINQNLLLAGDDAYNIQRSLRFRSSAPGYLSRTPGSAGNRKTWTWSGWVKRGELSRYQAVWFAGNNSTDTYGLAFEESTNVIHVGRFFGGWTWLLATSASYRDTSAWYHIVVAVDTTQATASNRVKLYVNGVQVTAFSTANYPTQNFDTEINSTSFQHNIGYQTINNAFAFNGYLTEINFIDGQALTPSSFGETDAQTGVWKPKKYSGTYGTNGFYLNFSDNSSNTATTIGKDSSGNGNNWTPNNISVTSGSTYDSMLDVPTLTSADAANFATLNPVDKGSSLTISAGNLQYDASGVVAQFSRSTIGVTSGKWYFEVNATAIDNGNAEWGIVNQSASNANYIGVDSNGWGFAPQPSGSSYKYNGGSAITYGSATGTGQYAVAFDADAGKVWFSDKNGTWISSGNPASGTNESFSGLTGTLFAALGQYSSTSRTTQAQINFGQRPFAYTPPTGFKALNTFNLPTPTIGATASTQANKYFDILTWTGTSTASGRTFTGLGFQPDFVWSKTRNQAYSHQLYDAVRGTGKRIQSNRTDAETTNPISGYISAFNSNGFTTVAGTTDNSWFNELNTTYVGWNWRAGNSTSSNTSGSITSTVSANTSAGFSIVTYTGTGANATVGHGLGVAPAMYIVKIRSGANNWTVWHQKLANTTTSYILLDSTAAETTSPNVWGSTAATSSTIGVGTAGVTNASGSTYVAYCFAQVAGYSAFGSYTGNGSSDGPFIYTGFRPRFLLIKNSSTTGSWTMIDTARDTSNLSTRGLYPDLVDAEDTSRAFDILSNGFKLRSSTAANANGVTLIYAAFAENPFKYSLAR